jgi:hypothetical protein
MAGKRFEARDKRVQKMSRDGLTEENLRSARIGKLAPVLRMIPFRQRLRVILNRNFMPEKLRCRRRQ